MARFEKHFDRVIIDNTSDESFSPANISSETYDANTIGDASNLHPYP